MSSTDHLFRSLNPSQLEAVKHFAGPQLILAGPGSGKTRVVTHRIAYLMHQGVAASQILGLTFTNKAADEMKQRLERLAPGRRVWISTFHRFCAKLLRQYASLIGLEENYSIYDTKDSSRMLKAVLVELGLEDSHFTADQIGRAIGDAKNRLITAEQYQGVTGSPLGKIVAQVYPKYSARMLLANAVDFDDMLLHIAMLLRQNEEIRRTLDERYQFIMVDEYQDTNLAQYVIVRALSNQSPNLSVTGDPDQAIYGWRGANLNNILDFEKDFPNVQVVRLEQNYRSTARILRVADELISNNLRRKPKTLFTENEDGNPVRLIKYQNQKEEAHEIVRQIVEQVNQGRRNLRDFAIFYRVNALSRALEFALNDHGIPYQMVNGLEFYQRKEIKDVVAFLHLIYNPKDDIAFSRVVNTPPRGIGKTTLQRIAEHASRYGIPLMDAAREAGLIESLNKRAAVAVAKFVTIIDRINVHATDPVEEIVGHVLSESGYHDHLAKSDYEHDEERLANVQELLTAASEFDSQTPEGNYLEQFLEQASLVNDTDAWEVDDDRVTLMTLHSAKGLEFPVVYIVALEQGLLPHERSRQDTDQLEEERRLLFVGITRAEQQLQLSTATYREFRGQRKRTIPSEFLMELPRAEMETTDSAFHIPPENYDHQSDEFEYQDSPPEEQWEDDSSDSNQVEYSDSTSNKPIEIINDQNLSLAHLENKLGIAAEMASSGSETGSKIEVDDFHQNMVVRHPKYGIGKIVALGGRGLRRTATVNFAGQAGQKKFFLAQSALQPINHQQ